MRHPERKEAPLDLLRLIYRSADVGEGWRQVSQTLWPTIQRECSKVPTLVEIEDGNPGRVRLTEEAQAVLRWS